MDSKLKKVEQDVLNVYQKVSPSIYPIETSAEEYKKRMDFMENLFLHRLNFPPKMFNNANLLEFGSGTGENSLYYLVNGAYCTFVEMNQIACQRADKLFMKFAPEPARYRIVEKSLFDFKSDEMFDIVVSLGVIHHTADKERAFRIKAKHLKKGGFLILGIGNSAGHFQRNLQRAIIYRFAKSAKTDEEIASLAEELFSEHIDRAEKFGGRSRKAIIYDTYVNPKVDTPSISDVLRWFSENGLRLYSSWSPIVPAVLGDSPNKPPLKFERFENLMSMPEFVYLAHSSDDIVQLEKFDKEIEKIITPFRHIVQSLASVCPYSNPFYFSYIQTRINELRATKPEFNLFASYIDRLMNLMDEVRAIAALMTRNRIGDIKEYIKNAKYLFKGTCGMGMSWYVGYKDE